MKRSFPVNINGRIFNIDEDAYNMLNEYLEQLKQTFSSPDEREIVEDIEGRIHEHFVAETNGDGSIITIEDVKQVIEVMGRPDQLGDAPADTSKSEETAEKKHGQMPPPYTGIKDDNATSHTQCGPEVRKKLYRRIDNKVFGGVLSGVATYLNWNPVILRLLVVILALWTAVFPLLIIYLVCWMVIPAAVTPRQKLEMEGLAVTPDNIGRGVTQDAAYNLNMDVSEQQGTSLTDVLGTMLNVIVKGCVAFAGFISSVVGFACAVAAVVLLFMGLGASLTSPELMVEVFDMQIPDKIMASDIPFTTVMITASMGLFAIAVPALMLLWGACCVVLKAKAPSRIIIITTIVVEVILIAAALLCGIYVNAHCDVLPAALLPMPVLIH